MESKERATIIAAIIGGLFACTAAIVAGFIGTFQPVVRELFSQALATSTPVVAPATVPSLGSSVTFILYSNFDHGQDFFVDGQFKQTIKSGEYAAFPVGRGTHQLQNCPVGATPSDGSGACVSLVRNVQDDPYFWEIYGDNNARVTPSGQVVFILGNTSPATVDFFVDGKFVTRIDSHKYVSLALTRGGHTFQGCPRNMNPKDNQKDCGSPQQIDVEIAVFVFTIKE